MPVKSLGVSAFTIPTEEPEADGTFEWEATTMVLVEVRAGGERGLGFTYTHAAAAKLVDELLSGIVEGEDAFSIAALWQEMMRAVRNLGRPGLSASAIAAVDIALWDLKARLLGLPLVALLGAVHEQVPVYGSGGFTSYDIGRLQGQLAGWREEGIAMMKMKVGAVPDDDLERVAAAREAIGEGVDLMVDANGAYSRKEALWFAEAFADFGVGWFEESVSSDDLDGLRLLRDRAPAGMDIAAGEYGYDLFYFRRMLGAGAVDVLQPDATRCAGFTGFLRAATLCEAYGVDVSAHTAPTLHAHVCAAIPRLRHAEYFHDHARIEEMLFDGALRPEDGLLRPDRTRPGLGLAVKWQDAEEYRTF